MKGIICFFALIISMQSCSQNGKKEKINNINLRKEIKNLQNFQYEPIYQLRVNSEYAFTIYINGIPIANKYVSYLKNYLAEINTCIPESGEQTIEIQIYPRFITENEQNEFLENDKTFNLIIEETSWLNGNLKEPKPVYEFNLPSGQYSTKKNLSFKAKFRAEIPYKLLDWRDAQNVSDVDSTLLKKEVLKYYTNLKEKFENQQGEDYINSLGKGLFNLYQASYFDEEEALKHINHRISFINKEKRKLADFENFEMEISADGKLVFLQRIDGFNKKEGILRRYYKKGPQQLVQIDDLILYLPKNGFSTYDFQVAWQRSISKGANP